MGVRPPAATLRLSGPAENKKAPDAPALFDYTRRIAKRSIVVALREIGDGSISPEDLHEDLIHSLQKYVEVDEPEKHAAPLLDADADPDGDTFDTISEDELLRGIESLAPPERRDD